MFLFGITGYSGSGKTTLNEKVVECLRSLGYSVSCVKDAHHQVDLDTPGKDTYRYRVSGAEQVILRTPDRWALMEETPEGRKPLGDILWTKRGDIVAVASDTPEGIPPGMPWLNLNEPRQVADFIVSLRDSWMKEKDNVKE